MNNISPLCKKRLKKDIEILKKEPYEYADSRPDPDNPLLWYFILKGIKDSEYDNGYFLGKIIHSPEYPMEPPNFYMLTPNGRFEINKKLCVSISGYHKDEWSPIWNMRNIIIGLTSFFYEDANSANGIGIGKLNYSITEKKILSEQSIDYNKKYHKKIWDIFSYFIDKN